MRHRVTHKHFNRDRNQRQALLKGLVRSLIVDGTITTTVTKAKETKRIADKLIHKAQTDSVMTRRVLHRFFGRRDVVNTLVERVAPAMKERVSGFTTIAPVANRRGDNAELATLSLMTIAEVPAELKGTLKSGKKYEVKTPKAKAAVVEKTAKAVKTTKAKPAAAKKPVAKAKAAK